MADHTLAGKTPLTGGSSRSGILLVLGLVSAALLVVAYAQLFATLWRMWDHNPNYSHGFLIPPVSLFLVWRMRRKLAEMPVRPSWAGLIPVTAGVALHVVGIRGDVALFQAYSFLILLAGLVWTLFGWAMLKQLAFPLAFLAFMNPTLPWFINVVSFGLKTIAAVGSVTVAQLLGVSVKRVGMDLYFASGTMTIEGACSGLNSLIALMALGALVAYLGAGSLWRRWLLFLLSIPVALGANIFRITSLCVVAGLTDTDTATGLFHDVGGFVLFGVALASLALLKQVLRC